MIFVGILIIFNHSDILFFLHCNVTCNLKSEIV